MKSKTKHDESNFEALGRVMHAARDVLDARRRFEEVFGKDEVPERITGSIKSMMFDLVSARAVRDLQAKRIERAEQVLREHGANGRVSVWRVRKALEMSNEDRDEMMDCIDNKMSKHHV